MGSRLIRVGAGRSVLAVLTIESAGVYAAVVQHSDSSYLDVELGSAENLLVGCQGL